MNKLDTLLESLTIQYAKSIGLTAWQARQMANELAICAAQGYNTRSELIALVKGSL